MNTASTDAQGVFILLIFAGFYFLPGIVGMMKGKNNAGAIVLLNLFLGWTFIGWVVALIWAAANDPKTYANRLPFEPNKGSGDVFTYEDLERTQKQMEADRRKAMLEMKWDE